MAKTFIRWVRQKLWRLKCERCGHEWERLGDPPEKCAACDTRYWESKPGTLKRGRPRKE